MKKLVLPLAATMALVAVAVFAQGQSQPQGQAKPAAAAPQNLPVKIGLVDMAQVFKQYEKFDRLRQDLTGQMAALQEEAKQVKAQVTSLNEELKQFNNGSPEYRAREEKIAKMASEFDAKFRIAQRDYARQEAEIFEAVYLEASDVIKQYAQYYNYTMVIRFNSEPIDAENPQKLANGLNKLVVYHRPQDDITEPVIEYLNRQFSKSQGKDKLATPAGTGANGANKSRN